MKHTISQSTNSWWHFLVVVAFVLPLSWLPFATNAYAAGTNTPGVPTLAGLKSIDVMKYTKDVMTSQPTDAQIDSIVQNAKAAGATHVAISIPMDATGAYPAGSQPAPRGAEAFTQKWADTIHSAGLHIIWRGTFNGLEGLYGFPRLVGQNRVDSSVWTGKIRDYISSHSSYFANGDVWAPLPERTEGIFSDGTSFLPATGGLQTNYANFFAGVKSVSDAAFAQIGKNVTTGMTANNASEIISGWIPKSLFDAAGYVAVDYYGSTHTPDEMDREIRAMHASTGKPVFIQEWGDYWNQNADPATRAAYLASMYAEMQKLSNDGVIIGVSYWGGWDNAAEGILSRTPAGFSLNSRGAILQNFFGGIASAAIQPSVSPQTVVGAISANVSNVSTPSPKTAVTAIIPQVQAATRTIDMAQACAWQYPDKNATAKQDISGNNYSWTCYGPYGLSLRKLGGIDLGSYCASTNAGGAVMDDKGWSCKAQ